MYQKSEAEIKEKLIELIQSSKYVKIGGIIILSILAFYLLGHIFKITAHTVRGYKDLKSAVQYG